MILTSGTGGVDAPPIFSGFTGALIPHDERARRLTSILAGVQHIRTPEVVTREVTDTELQKVHDPGMIAFFRDMATVNPNERPLFPETFPRRVSVAPQDLQGRFGLYCTGTQTPYLDSYWNDALRAAGCSLEGAERLLGGEDLVYVACRPPGHHAGPDYFGGFCYLNNTALAAERLSREGRVAVLDIDYHHGNGTQDCFYSSDEVLTVSIHADARFAYPYFSGSTQESGSGVGRGYNVNFPVPLSVTTADWFAVLDQALSRILDWRPDSLVLAFGADTYRLDPVGGFALEVPDYRAAGAAIAAAGCPLLVVQEGGYATDALGDIVASLLAGLMQS